MLGSSSGDNPRPAPSASAPTQERRKIPEERLEAGDGWGGESVHSFLPLPPPPGLSLWEGVGLLALCTGPQDPDEKGSAGREPPKLCRPTESLHLLFCSSRPYLVSGGGNFGPRFQLGLFHKSSSQACRPICQ